MRTYPVSCRDDTLKSSWFSLITVKHMFCGFYIRQAKKKQAISKAGITLSRISFTIRGDIRSKKLILRKNVWFRVASCLISGLFTIAIKIADHLQGSRLCLISIHRPDEFTSFQIVSYLHCKFTACWKLKSTDFLKPYTKCNKQLHSNWFSLVMAW